MGRKKKQFPELTVRGMHHSGHGYAVADGRRLLVEGGLPGDVVNGVERRKKKGLLQLRVDAYLSYGTSRVAPFCRHFDLCGGCTLQHVDYDTQLSLKAQMVASALGENLRIAGAERAGRDSAFGEPGADGADGAGSDTAPGGDGDPGGDVADGAGSDTAPGGDGDAAAPAKPRIAPTVEPILGCEADRRYRNKMEYSFSNSRWLTEEEKDSAEVADRRALGFHVPGRFDRVLDIEECHLQPEPTNRIRNGVKDFALERGYSFYDPREHRGLLRLLMIRTSLAGETQVTVMFGEDDPAAREEILGFLREEFPQINSLYYVVNSSKNDALYPHEPIHVSGSPFIVEKCGDLDFRIYPKSFYQTNPAQAVRLYDVAREYADLSGGETVYDLFSGLGSIALYLADQAGKVVGIESVEDAVGAARENAALNGVENVEFHHGEVEALLDERFLETHGAPDCVVLDPPRPGVHEKALRVLLAARPRRIVYVSCNAETQGRDVAILSEAYDVERMRGVDMFPQTRHVEHVMRLTLRE